VLKEGNKQILIERKVTSTSGYKEREQSYLDRKEWNKHIKIERKGTSVCACFLPFYQDVLVPFLSIKMCLLLSLLSRCACSLPFYQDVIVPFLSINARCACYLPFYQDVLVPFLSIKM
jgi:hypothetical protein